MRTSGGGNRDLTMMTVPLAIFIVYGVLSGGGVDGVLRTLERSLWGAIEWVSTNLDGLRYGVDGAARRILAALIGFVRDVF